MSQGQGGGFGGPGSQYGKSQPGMWSAQHTQPNQPPATNGYGQSGIRAPDGNYGAPSQGAGMGFSGAGYAPQQSMGSGQGGGSLASIMQLLQANPAAAQQYASSRGLGVSGPMGQGGQGMVAPGSPGANLPQYPSSMATPNTSLPSPMPPPPGLQPAPAQNDYQANWGYRGTRPGVY